MAVSKLYTLHAVARTGIGAVVVKQVSEHGHNPGLDVYFGGSVGHLGDTMAAVRKAEPVSRFSTTDIPAALGMLAETGPPVAGFASDTPFELWYAELDQNGYIKTTAPAHIKIAITNGILIPVSLTADHGGEASLTMELHAISADGTTNPITVTVNEATLPTSAAQTILYTAGPLKIGGTSYGDIQTLNFAFNLELLKKGGGGEVWPTFVSIQRPWRPVITATAHDLTKLSVPSSIGLAGLDTTVMYLRKKAIDGGGNVADGTAEHVSLTVYDGTYALPDMGNTFGQEAERPIELTAMYNGTDDIVDIDTATAIT